MQNLAMAAVFITLCVTQLALCDSQEQDFSDKVSISKRSVRPNDILDSKNTMNLLKNILTRLDGKYAYTDEDLAGNDVYLSKRKSAFWQPMGGPVPVETRFVSFGSRLEPENIPNAPNSGIKAMRYGRRK